MRKMLWILFGALLTALLFARAARAQDGPPRQVSADEVNAIAKQLYCPVCENTPLDVCPTQACAEWREVIADMLAEGKTEEEIKLHFVTQYGDRVLAEPPARGLNWLVYVFPPVAFILGAFVLSKAFKSWKKTDSQFAGGAAEGSLAPNLPTHTGDETPDDEYVRRIEEELRKR